MNVLGVGRCVEKTVFALVVKILTRILKKEGKLFKRSLKKMIMPFLNLSNTMDVDALGITAAKTIVSVIDWELDVANIANVWIVRIPVEENKEEKRQKDESKPVFDIID